MNQIIQLRIKKNPEIPDECIVQWAQDGKIDQDKCYFTDDLTDARETIKAEILRLLDGGFAIALGQEKDRVNLIRHIPNGSLAEFADECQGHLDPKFQKPPEPIDDGSGDPLYG